MRLPRNLITLGLGLTLLNAGLATAAEELPAPIRMVQEKGARILGSFDARMACAATPPNTRTRAWRCT